MKSIKFIVPIVLICVVGIDVTVSLVLVNRNTPDDEVEGPVVVTNLGPIRGLTATGNGGNYSMFLGIPYATVNPSNIFGPSIPHKGFQGTFNAFDDSARCPQLDGMVPVGNLDCLHLNIHVPNTASATNRLPVMVWIHGGAFISGFAGRWLYDPIFLVAQEVIVVTLNYRLGIYGFLCLNIPEVPGNQGLKDQLTAMRWVKDNIEAFGGDVDKITLFGESAGAVSADLHFMFSQEDLFNNIILQSGTALSDYPYNASDPAVVLRITESLGHITSDLHDAVEFLGTVDPLHLVTASIFGGLASDPCVEQDFDNVERYITARPANVDVPKAKSKPVMIGFNNNEFGIDFLDPLSDREPLHYIEDSFYFMDRGFLDRAMDIVRKFYVGDEDYDGAEKEQQFADFRSDFIFLHPTYRSIEKYLESGATSIYHYMFSYEGDRNMMSILLNGTSIQGAFHADELGYLFDLIIFPLPPSPADQLMIDRMTTMWANFAKYSNPTPETTEILPVPWPVVTNQSMHCLNIDSELHLQRRAFHDRMAFWDLFYMMYQAIS